MTDKELEQKAEEYADNINLKDVADNTRATFEQAYIDGYKQGLREENDKLLYARSIIADLLHNSDEYARQRALDFIEKGEK